jgi:hypothetical protein
MRIVVVHPARTDIRVLLFVHGRDELRSQTRLATSRARNDTHDNANG